MPKVSICIPTFNQTKYLNKTLKSIFNQTYTDYEIIITDDTPSSLIEDLIHQYDHNKQIRYYHNTTSLGSPKNWNLSISKAKGQLIKILHHDDWFTNNHSLAEFVKFFDNNPKLSFAFSSSNVLLESGANWEHQISTRQLAKIKKNPTHLFIANKIGGPSCTMFRTDLDAHFDEKLTWLVDIDFYIRTLIKHKVVRYIPAPLVTTFAAEGRISDSCINNKYIDVYEHFYLFDKIHKNSKKDIYSRYKCIMHLINICDRHEIRNTSNIRAAGYLGKVPSIIKIYFLFHRIFNYHK